MFFVLKNKGLYSLKPSRNTSLKKIQPKSAWRTEIDQIYKPLITTLWKEAHLHKSVLGQSFTLLILIIDGFRNHIISRLSSASFCIVEDYYNKCPFVLYIN